MLLKSTDVITEGDLRALCPASVSLQSTRLRLDPGEEQGGLLSKVDSACDIIGDCLPELILFACASATFAGGAELDESVGKRITERTGVEAVTAAAALVSAAERSGMRKVLLVTPYSEAIDRQIVRMLGDRGVEVASILSVRYSEIFSTSFLSGFPGAKNRLVEPAWLHRLALARIAALPSVDGIVVACTGLRVSEVIAELERDSKLPVVAANQAMAAEAARRLGVKVPIRGYGKLLE